MEHLLGAGSEQVLGKHTVVGGKGLRPLTWGGWTALWAIPSRCTSRPDSWKQVAGQINPFQGGGRGGRASEDLTSEV